MLTRNYTGPNPLISFMYSIPQLVKKACYFVVILGLCRTTCVCTCYSLNLKYFSSFVLRKNSYACSRAQMSSLQSSLLNLFGQNYAFSSVLWYFKIHINIHLKFQCENIIFIFIYIAMGYRTVESSGHTTIRIKIKNQKEILNIFFTSCKEFSQLWRKTKKHTAIPVVYFIELYVLKLFQLCSYQENSRKRYVTETSELANSLTCIDRLQTSNITFNI